MKVALPAVLTALFVHLMTAAESRADLISWSYSWSNSPGVIEADTPGTGSISLTNESLHNVQGNSNIVATNLRTSSTAPDSNPAMFTNKSYSLVLTLVDNASGQSGTLTFKGALNGTVSQNNSNLQNTFLGALTQKLVLGNNLYTVTMGTYTPPGPPDSANAGSISSYANVNVVHLVATPEPSTWILSLVGLLTFLCFGVRRIPCLPCLT